MIAGLLIVGGALIGLGALLVAVMFAADRWLS